MKSNATASATSSASTQKLVWTASIAGGGAAAGLGVLEDDALDHVGDILAAVGDRLEVLVHRLELDQFANVDVVAKELAHRRAHHPVGVALEAVDLLAGLQCGLGDAEIGRASCRERG